MCFQDSSETCTEVDDGGNDAGTDLALFQLVEERGADLGLGLLEPCTAGQHNVVAVLVQLDDFGFDLLTDVRSEVAHTAHLDEGCGQEAAQTDVEDKTTLDNLDDGTGDNTVFFLDLLDVAPGTLVLSTLLGEDQAAFFVFLGEHQGFDEIANGDNVSGINVVLDGQLAGGDDTFGLVTDVEQNFIAVDLDDGTFDEVSVVEVLDGGVDCCEEVLSGTDVVNGDYGGTGLLGGGDGHVVGAPLWIVSRSGKPPRSRYGTQPQVSADRVDLPGQPDLWNLENVHVVHAHLV
jgi:hypothetical protein